MTALVEDLSKLEYLKKLLDRYNPIKYQSGEEVRSLAEEIPQIYGAIEEVYKKFAGNHEVEVKDGSRINIYNNYFEAGYLSGRTFHAHQGYQELMRVIGRVRAKVDKSEEIDIAPDSNQVFSLLHPEVKKVAMERFNSGHYADSVEAALKALNNEVRKIAIEHGASEMDGPQLMHYVFSPKNPIIVLDDLSKQSGRDIQQGFMEMFAGAMSAIRNPKAHDNLSISPERAIHLLFVVSMLWYTLDDRV